MTPPARRTRRGAVRGLVLACAAGLVLASCGGGATSPSSTSGTPTPAPTTSPSDAATSGSAAPTTSAAPTALEQAQQRVAAMTPQQQAGQLLMVGLDLSGGTVVPSGVATALQTYRVGSVMLRGRTTAGAAAVGTLVGQLQDAVPDGVPGLLVSTDQEGGQVQVLKGPGISTVPDGPAQAALGPTALQQAAYGWGRELRRAGVNLNLAPVADLVDPAAPAANPPVGAFGRNLGFGVPTVSAAVTAYVAGMQKAGVSCTVKHFPGLGAVTENTDTNANVTDPTTRPGSPSLQVFQAGIDAGSRLVMMSLATYPRIDPSGPAAFSSTAVGLLRDDLGFDGVVISDDLGQAAQVAAYPAGERATRFVGAGGDLVLTVDPATIPAMAAAIVGQMQTDPAFAAKVRAAAARVLVLKRASGLW